MTTVGGIRRPGSRMIPRGVARAVEPALLSSGDWLSKRSPHRVTGGQEGRSERPGEAARATPARTVHP